MDISVIDVTLKTVRQEFSLAEPIELARVPLLSSRGWTSAASGIALFNFLQNTHFSVIGHLSRDVRKPVFGVSDQVRHKPACTSSEKS